MEFRIEDRLIGDGHPIFIIAELSANHMNDYDIAVKTIEAMAKSGADAVKFQTYTPDTITLDCDNEYFQIKQGTIWDGQVLYNLYEDAFMPWDWQPKLKKVAEDLGLIVFSSPFDETSVDFLEDMDMGAYKIASFEITDIPLIEYVASKNKPVIISTGIASKEDIDLAIKTCKDADNDKIAVLKCTSSYPAPLEEINLKTIPDLKENFKTVVGLSDHTLGKVSYELSDKMKANREFSRSLFAVKDIKKGELITKDNVKSIRPGFGLHPKYLSEIVGCRASEDIERGTPFKLEFVNK